MDIAFIPLAIAIAHEMKAPLMNWGQTGLGKSTTVADYCRNNFHFYDEDTEGNKIGKVPYGFCDLRASQLENTDIRGLPAKEVETQTVKYYVPHELPRHTYINREGEKFNEPGEGRVLYKGVLFLDEPNRAEDDVLQALFQLIYDRKVGEYTLPEGWAIVGAGNHAGKNYNVNQFFKDAAMLDRWIHISLEASKSYYDSWAKYVSDKPYDSEVLTRVLQFTSADPDNFVKRDIPDSLAITPSPRSWERVLVFEQVIKKYKSIASDEAYTAVYNEMLTGIIGMAAFSTYNAFKVEISPLEILEKGLTRDIENKLNKLLFDKNGDILQTGHGRGVLQSLCFGLINHAKRDKNPNPAYIQNTLHFGKWVCSTSGSKLKDIGFGFFLSLLQGEYDKGNTVTGFLISKSLKNLIRNTNKNISSKPWVAALLDDPEVAAIIEKAGITKREAKYEQG